MMEPLLALAFLIGTILALGGAVIAILAMTKFALNRDWI